MNQVFLFHIDLTLPVAMVTENGLVIHQVLSQCTFSEHTHTHARMHTRTQHFLHFHICVREGSDQPVHPSDQNLHWPHKEAQRSLAILLAPSEN